MRKRLLAAGGGAVLAGGALTRRYRRDTGAARARLAAVDRTVIQTPSGAVGLADRPRSQGLGADALMHPASSPGPGSGR